MIIEKSHGNRNPSLVTKAFESKKLTWKDKFKRDLFRQNLKQIQLSVTKRNKQMRQQDQKRAASRCLSKLFQKEILYIQDDQQQFPNHGYYSSYIPLAQQTKLKDQLTSTFPYIEYLLEKNHSQTRTNVYNQISTYLRVCVENNSVESGWRSCLRKYLCDLDVIKAIQIYIEILKKGTFVMAQLHRKFGNGCTRQVFFHRVCQASKYFKQSSKINKNMKISIQTNQQISQVTLPKSSKFLFCAICLLYDCNQHNIDDAVSEFNYQYVSRNNIIPESVKVKNILTLIKFHRGLILMLSQHQQNDQQRGQQQRTANRNLYSSIQMQLEQGQEQEQYIKCSSTCYKHLNRQTFAKKSSLRRPIISLIHRSMIALGCNIFSYDPCLICLWVGKQLVREGTTTSGLQGNRGITCQNIFFYLIQQYNIVKKLRNKLYSSEEEYLTNQPSRPESQTAVSVIIPNRRRKQKPKFDHDDNDNYRIGCCFHYFIGQETFDHNCQRCVCKKRGFCLPQCLCPPECRIKKLGCSCKTSKDQCRTKKCQCFVNNQQCIPGLCKGCFDSCGVKNKKNSCRNSMIRRKQTKKIRVGDSNIAGLGAFAQQDIAKDQLVVIYTGQITDHSIDYIREGLRFDNSFYNFGSHEGGAIDARFMGNKSRFINHMKGGDENLQASSCFSEGKWKTVLYSKKSIKKGEQLYFDYDVDNQLAKNFPGKYDFIKKTKK